MIHKYYTHTYTPHTHIHNIHMHAEFKITVSHRAFSDQNWLFLSICKTIWRFHTTSSILCIPNPQNGHILLYMAKHLLNYLAICPCTFHSLFWTLHMYRIAQNVGGGKHWWIWRLSIDSPKFSHPNIVNTLKGNGKPTQFAKVLPSKYTSRVILLKFHPANILHYTVQYMHIFTQTKYTYT